MSYDAIQWAMDQPVKPAITKFVLVAMADCVNAAAGAMECWPSYAYLARRTGASQNTVEASVYRLRQERFLVDTGRREGGTGKVIVYRLNDPKCGTIPPTTGSKAENQDASATRAQTTPNAGSLTDSEIPPNPTGNPPKSEAKSPQKEGVTTPDLGSRTRKEQGKNQEGKRKRASVDAATFPLPEWLSRDDWERWCKDRKQRGKGVTDEAAVLQIKALDGYRKDGFAPAEVIDNSIASGYQGLFPPKRNARPASSGKHTGFRDINYLEGVTNGVPDA